MNRLEKFIKIWLGRFATVAISMFIFGIFGTAAQAQSFTIRLLNAKSGKIMRDKNVTITWGPVGYTKSVIHIGQDGLGHSDVPIGATNFLISGGPKTGKEPYRIPFEECNGDIREISSYISLAQILEKGVVLRNSCGEKTFPPRQGELVFWALPLPWWKPDFQ